MYKCLALEHKVRMYLKNGSSTIFIFLVLSIVIVSGILGIGSIDYALSQPATEPGGTETPPPDATTEPGGTETPPPDARGTTLAKTTTTTSTFSSTKGGFHISTTITNTTTVIPVQR